MSKAGFRRIAAWGSRWIACWLWFSFWLCLPAGAAEPAREAEHPRLYFTQRDLPALRADRTHGWRGLIGSNLLQSANWCLTRTPRSGWIPPVTPDPAYENLYDRFYAIMGDLAITEHLAFAYAITGESRYGDAARSWVMASCRAWAPEADGQPDSGKAYAVSRLLKGLAVGYDIAFDRFSEGERQEVRSTIRGICARYFTHFFDTPTIRGASYHTHHAVVEWASFGVAALALQGEVPASQDWLQATIQKFKEHLLPKGLAPDGAQVEGATFWASTLQYRLFFLDALRRVTGEDLFREFQPQMRADLALASIAQPKRSTRLDEHHENVILEPAYGQLDYYAPVLLALAREYRQPLHQYLARWDHSLGSLQRTRYITPHGEELLFELGGYAYLWCDASVPARPDPTLPLSWEFPSVGEAYARVSWKPGDLLVGVRQGELVVHAGGETILIEPGTTPQAPPRAGVVELSDTGRHVSLRCPLDTNAAAVLTVRLDRRRRVLSIERSSPDPWSFWSQGEPRREGERFHWKGGARMELEQGQRVEWQPTGFSSRLTVGNGKLVLRDPGDRRYPLTVLHPDGNDLIRVRISLPGGPRTR